MMKKCPNCGSTEIIPDLIVFAHGGGNSGSQLIYISLQEPEPQKRPFIWAPNSETTRFRAVCGKCGHVELYTNYHQKLLAAHKKGYVSQQNV